VSFQAASGRGFETGDPLGSGQGRDEAAGRTTLDHVRRAAGRPRRPAAWSWTNSSTMRRRCRCKELRARTVRRPVGDQRASRPQCNARGSGGFGRFSGFSSSHVIVGPTRPQHPWIGVTAVWPLYGDLHRQPLLVLPEPLLVEHAFLGTAWRALQRLRPIGLLRVARLEQAASLLSHWMTAQHQFAWTCRRRRRGRQAPAGRGGRSAARRSTLEVGAALWGRHGRRDPPAHCRSPG